MNRRDRLFKDKAMEQTMEWILKTAEEQDRRVKEVTRNAEFVTTQGALSKIACSVYDYEHWLDRGVSLTVQKFDDIIFLSESNVTQSSSGSQFQEDDYARRVRHWNKKFAQYICSDKTAGDQGTSMPMNVGKVKSIVVSQVCAEEISFSVIYRSEIDCFDADGDDVVVLGTQFDSIEMENISAEKLSGGCCSPI
uniref:Decapping nuclease n=1 Tax=Ditylenchus dipsaci TaxID=166011 RepID=A0A915DQ04_9BILA